MVKAIILLLLCCSTFAQSPKVADKPIEKPALSLDLTTKEIEAGLPLDSELARLNAEEARALNRIFTGQTDEQILLGAYKWRDALNNKKAAMEKYNAWLDSVRKAHDCAKCELDLTEPGKPRLKRLNAQTGKPEEK